MQTTPLILALVGVPLVATAAIASRGATGSDSTAPPTVLGFSHDSGLTTAVVVVPGASQPLTVFVAGVNEHGLLECETTVVSDPAQELASTTAIAGAQWTCSLVPTVAEWSLVDSADDVQVAWWPTPKD